MFSGVCLQTSNTIPVLLTLSGLHLNLAKLAAGLLLKKLKNICQNFEVLRQAVSQVP